ncbi:hypothetical protein D3C75_785330 [compost metagenome]|uniref:XRE family transcriptional regulator n=1 Tax=Silvania hatchlandensis TaxID=2926469 RepID=A0A9J6PW82_9ENTR|nr:XRE family transcriptional regulator [Silvania hatchlandensis]MCU6664591.1 XRE family transcriptional regulator [Silvania hatchlandensis]
MNLDEIKSLLEKLPESDKQKMAEEWGRRAQPLITAENSPESDEAPVLNALAFPLLTQILTTELKRQDITYEEMAIQIGVSLSTFKRLIANPSSAKAINLHTLLKELGIKVWLEK